MVTRPTRAVGELDIVVSVDTVRGPTTVHGSVESRYGRRSFAGWLDLLGQLEELVERACDEATEDSARSR